MSNRSKCSSLMVVGNHANLIMTALAVAASSYEEMAKNPDLPDRTADTFEQYARDLREFASNADGAEYVEFGNFRD
jgi:hypothetical protein